jgi:hypothetical protein
VVGSCDHGSEDGGGMVIRNVGIHPPHYAAPEHIKPQILRGLEVVTEVKIQDDVFWVVTTNCVATG